MNILIIGGSNSLLKDGYVSHLKYFMKPDVDVNIIQLSVGATTTLSAIGRLHETFPQENIDVILYEYSINDGGHFSWRSGGMESWQFCFYLLVKTLNKFYPSAIFIPLIFAQKRHFSFTVKCPFYDFQIENFKELDVQYIDIRAWFSDLFLEQMPAWLYRDEAHYATPHATSIISAHVAKKLRSLDFHGFKRVDVIYANIKDKYQFPSVKFLYIPAVNLKEFCTGAVSVEHVENSLMKLDFLRIYPGGGLTLSAEMFPLALYLKSDACHGKVNFSLIVKDKFSVRAQIGTRHSDTNSANFVYSSIPIPFLWGQTLLSDFGQSHLFIDVPLGSSSVTDSVSFDCFELSATSTESNYFDLVGVLFVCVK